MQKRSCVPAGWLSGWLMPSYRALAAASLLSLLLGGDVLSETVAARAPLRAIEVAATPIFFDRTDAAASRFGRLTWLGGVSLTSPAREFGGYSGIAIFPDGQSFLAVSDGGMWLEGKLTYAGGKLTGVKETRSGPLLSKKGKTLKHKRDADAEDIALWHKKSGSYALISFERKQRIGRFPLVDGMLEAPVSYVDLPAATEQMEANKGLESVTVLADGSNKGTVLTFAEKLLDDNGNHTGWLLRGDKMETLHLVRHDDFEITSLATLPNGNVLVLERSFSLFAGVAMRLSEIDGKDLVPGKAIETREILSANMRYDIDNMEGLGVHTNDKGETILTLVSDDNFNTSGLQRTLLMQFKLD